MATKDMITLADDMKRFFSTEAVAARRATGPRQYSLRGELSDTVPAVYPSEDPSYDSSPDPAAARELACWVSAWCEDLNAMSWDQGHVDTLYSIIASGKPWEECHADDKRRFLPDELAHMRELHARAGGYPSIEDYDVFVSDAEYTPPPYVWRKPWS